MTRRNPFGVAAGLQAEAVQTVMHMLGDEDTHVREAAGAAMMKLVPRLFFTSDWPGT